MGPLRSRRVRGLVLWTLAMLVVAMVSLVQAQQACFIGFPSVPCPDGQDWRVGLLTFAFFGVPLMWLIGLVVAFVGRSVTKRRRERHPSSPGEE